mmetsp:Transcript_41993/g.100956  ORF Transcript_41993/g.100956 Transcript_41993/m.100956 type:complete len:317 (-) Transcript_41993:931-1881(-)
MQHLAISLHSRRRGERVNVGVGRPRHGEQSGCRIQLHSAATQRDHRICQGQVFASQTVDVAHHIRFGLNAIKDGLCQKSTLAPELVRQQTSDLRNLVGACLLHRKLMLRMHRCRFFQFGQQVFHVLLSVSLVERKLNVDASDLARRDVVLQEEVDHPISVNWVSLQSNSIKEVSVRLWLEPDFGRAHGKKLCQSMDSTRNARQAARSVINCIHGRHIGEQRLRGADIGSRLVQPDMLLPGLQRHSDCLVALRVDAHTNDTARHAPRALLAGSQIGRSRSTIQHWDPESLHAPDNDVRSELRRGLRHTECQWVCRHN